MEFRIQLSIMAGTDKKKKRQDAAKRKTRTRS